jgi:translation initiation factor IF-2
MPDVGTVFESFSSKKEVESYIQELKSGSSGDRVLEDKNIQTGKRIPLVIKTDVMGTIEAIEKEVLKLNTPEISFKIISRGVGAINESDLKMARDNKESIIVGFNTKMDSGARDLNEQLKVNIQIFNIIYKLTDWLKEILDERRPRQETVEVTGTLKVLKTFGATKERQVVGGRVTTGRITDGGTVRIIRRDFEIGRGKIVGLQLNKIKVKEVQEETDCGLLIESKLDIAPGDVLEAFIISIK